MYHARLITGHRHKYQVMITSPKGLPAIEPAIDKKLWQIKKTGNTLRLDAKTKKSTASGSYRVRGGTVRPLDMDQRDMLNLADDLTMDTEWSLVISLFDMLSGLGYDLLFEERGGGAYLFRTRSPKLPPRVTPTPAAGKKKKQ